jgi:hypothetical protein
MTLYAWTITMHGRQSIERVSGLDEMEETLRILDLPGVSPPDWIISEIVANGHEATGRWDHPGTEEERWSLTWTMFAYDPET